MDLASFVPLVLQASIMMTVVALGLEANIEGILTLARRPARIARSLLAMNVVMPVLAVGLSAGFDLHPAVQVALVALAVSPVPPILPRKQLKAGVEAVRTTFTGCWSRQDCLPSSSCPLRWK